MFAAALSVAPEFGLPTAAFSHTFFRRQLDAWRGIVGKLADLRAVAGFDPLPEADALWRAQDRMIVTAVAAFETAAPIDWDHVRHVGPVLESERVAAPTELPWPDGDPRPLVLVRFITTEEQRSATKRQRALDALGELSARVVATTGAHVDPDELHAPLNAAVYAYAAHHPILARAALTVTHGGHGTLMRALRHGVPVVVVPGFAHDRAPNAAAAAEWGAGLALVGDADAAAIRAAAAAVLADPSFLAGARACAAAIAGLDGAAGAVDEIEALLARSRTPAA